MFNTVVSIIVMLLASVVGFFIGTFFNNGIGGSILFAVIAGIACIVHLIDNKFNS